MFSSADRRPRCSGLSGVEAFSWISAILELMSTKWSEYCSIRNSICCSFSAATELRPSVILDSRPLNAVTEEIVARRISGMTPTDTSSSGILALSRLGSKTISTTLYSTS